MSINATEYPGEIVLDIEPYMSSVKEEPTDYEESHYFEYNNEEEHYGNDSSFPFDSDREFPLDFVKHETYDDNDDKQNQEEKEKKCVIDTKYTVHALPSTSSQEDNMIYFEIPALEEEDMDVERPVARQVNRVEKERPFECSICLRKCVSISDLRKHRLIHSGELPYACEVCPKKFNQMSNLIRHRATHSTAKPFKCSVCSKTFSQASYLKKHNLIHSGEKPYCCVVCPKRFTDYSTLSKHKLIHSGEKPFVCGICMKRFNQLASLRRHEITHKDEKPYECKICGKKFGQSHHLKRHQAVHRVMCVNMSLYKKGKKVRKIDSLYFDTSKDKRIDSNYEMTFS